MAEIPISLAWETALVPSVVSLAVAGVASRVTRLSPIGIAASLSLGFVAGWATQEWAKLAPSRYIDWMPYAAGLLGLIACVRILLASRGRLWWLIPIACGVVTWFLVPSFPRLEPPRPYALAMVATASLLLVLAVEPLPGRLDGRILIASLMATGTASAIIIAQSFGMKLAQTTGILTASLVGALFFSRKCDQDRPLGLAGVFLPLLCNLLFMGYATSTSEVPVYCYGVVLMAPLALWIQAARPESKLLVPSLTLLVLILGIAVVPALLAHPPWEAVEY